MATGGGRSLTTSRTSASSCASAKVARTVARCGCSPRAPVSRPGAVIEADVSALSDSPRWISRPSTRFLADAGEPGFRSGQVWEWAARGARSYAEMTNVPAPLRERLERELPLSTLDLRETAKSDDGTEKALFATADGRRSRRC